MFVLNSLQHAMLRYIFTHITCLEFHNSFTCSELTFPTVRTRSDILSTTSLDFLPLNLLSDRHLKPDMIWWKSLIVLKFCLLSDAFRATKAFLPFGSHEFKSDLILGIFRPSVYLFLFISRRSDDRNFCSLNSITNYISPLAFNFVVEIYIYIFF